MVRLHRREDPVEETVANKEGEEVVVEVVQPRVAVVVRNPRNRRVYALRIFLSFVMVVHIVLYQIDQIQDNQHLR